MNTHVKPPAEPQDAALYVRTPVTPEEAFQAIGRLRKEARDEIDRLIRFLDKTDDYVSREVEDQVDDWPCDGDELEPSLCGVTTAAANMPVDGQGSDMEEEHDGREPQEDDEDGADTEPSLCGVTASGHPTCNDLEDDVFDHQQGSTPTKWLQAAQHRRNRKVHLRWLDGTPVTAENLCTMPSNVTHLDSAAT